MLVPIVAILMTFGVPAYILKRVFDLREKRLELEAGGAKELEGMREENRLLRERVEAMEDVVYAGDFELNQKLKKLAATEEATTTSLLSDSSGP